MPPLPIDPIERVEVLLEAAIDAKEGGARRGGQVEMAGAIAGAIDQASHLLCEAGPGTGKSFGYLIPAIASGEKVIVSTATKSLQDQLDSRDLPFLAEALAPLGVEFSWAAIKGRQNYLCLSKLEESREDSDQGGLFDEEADGSDLIATLIEWAEVHETGDRDDLPIAVPDEVWSEFSVSGMECPGREECPQGRECFAMAAFDRAATADVVIVNHHLYGAGLALEGGLLPEHDVVIFDEAHRLEDTMASALGIELTPGRLWQLHRTVSSFAKRIMPPAEVRRLLDPLRDRALSLESRLGGTVDGHMPDPGQTEVGGEFTAIAAVLSEINGRMRSAEPATPGLRGARARALRLGGHLAGDLAMGLDPPDSHVSWVEPDGDRKRFKLAPIDVGPLLAERLLSERPTIMTSATLSVGGSLVPLATRLGFSPDPDEVPLGARMLSVGSPFDFEYQGRIYVAAGLPDPRQPAWRDAAAAEIVTLVEAAGGRALVLTTSYRMLDLAAEKLREGTGLEVLAQRDLPKRRLVERFEEEETSVLVATMGFWEGLDIPGRSLELVVIDRLPFPRPDDPLWVARRELAEAQERSPFQTVDLPRATMLLAQGVGRLIRTTSDRGVVALLDSRLAKMSYGRVVLGSLPPMPITADREEVVSFLNRL
ncbi:MAG: ATP-dependent DNA helicase [Acidimicrobiia bacterium]|nr:ATP-dependent DNA helicase [Acidimicrobiia bacterium]